MFLKKKFKNFLVRLTLFTFLVTGVFSFCFTHEAMAHDEGGIELLKLTTEIHDDHCNGDIAASTLTSSGNSSFQIFHKYFFVVAYFENQTTDFFPFLLESPSTLARGEPPSPQSSLLQNFRC